MLEVFTNLRLLRAEDFGTALPWLGPPPGLASDWLAVRSGRVEASGSGPPPAADRTIDLGGAWVMPGFVDAHCHVLSTGLDLLKPNLGGCGSPEEVLDALRDALPAVPTGQWLHAVHYDQTKFSDGRHMHRAQLDAISDSVPILLRHVNGHASVANSATLAAAGITEDSEDPRGGSFVRDDAGSLTGVLLERGHEMALRAEPSPSERQMADAILLAAERMRAFGITAATDMMTGGWGLGTELRAYAEAARRGCPVRLRLFMQYSHVIGPRAIDPGILRELTADMDGATCRVEGLKIFADGAIGSATAAIYGVYEGQPAAESSGQLIYSPERLAEMVRAADASGWRVAIHSIGDRSTDIVLDCLETCVDPTRHRIEHALMLSDSQIGRLAAAGCQVCTQPEFLLRFGHAYRRQLGPARAASLVRCRSMLDAGVPLSFSSDRPIVEGDPLTGIESAVHRPEHFDVGESISLSEGVRLYTRAAAAANGDEDQGTLLAGSLADFQVRGHDGGVRQTFVAGDAAMARSG